MPNYDFTTDWFTHNIPNFERFLTPLKGSPCRLLEIGTFEGRSTVWLIENVATHASARIDAVDQWEHPRLPGNLRATGHAEKVTFHCGPSSIVLRSLGGGYDFVYVDASHQADETLEDAIHAFRLAKIGGTIAFDDYELSEPDQGTPKPGIDAFLNIFAGKIEVLYTGYQVWCRKVAGDTIPANNAVPLRLRFTQFRRHWRGRLKNALLNQF